MKPMQNKTIFVAGLTAVLGFVFSQAMAWGEIERKAIVTVVEGVADVQKAGASGWAPVSKGMELAAGDTLRTSLDSLVDIQLEDGSALRLTEETQMTIESLVEKTENARFLGFFQRPVEAQKSKLKLTEGKILASVTPRANSQSSFSVETPKGVAGVRGTNWSVGLKELMVRAGFVDWKPNPGASPSKQDLLGALAKVMAKVFGRTASDAGDSDRSNIRVNEGMGAEIDNNGNVTFSGLTDAQVDELKNFQAQATLNDAAGAAKLGVAPGKAQPTHSDRENEDFTEREVKGGAGAVSGNLRSETGSGALPNNAGEAQGQNVGVLAPPRTTGSSGFQEP